MSKVFGCKYPYNSIKYGDTMMQKFRVQSFLSVDL